jgi:DnaJ-class molecular chaperone
MRKASELLAELAELIEAQQERISDQRLQILSLQAELSQLKKNAASSAASAWEVLGLDPGASTAEVQAAFRALSRRLHPDTPGGDAVAFQALVEARETVLSGCR